MKALKLAKSISGAGNWPIDLPKYTEFMVIDIFIGKSAWHDNYATNFSLVKANFPELVDWLEDENADEDEDRRVWGIAKKDYTFLDLKEFVENGGKLKVKKRRSPSTEEDRSVKGKQRSHKRNVFSTFIQQTFSSKVSLATVLLVLFSMTENPELLSLHARQQNPIYDDENKTLASGWIRSLSRAMMHRLKTDTNALFCDGEFLPDQNYQATKLSTKLDAFATLLKLTPYDHKNKFKGNLLPVSYDAIQAVHTICPDSIVCMDAECKPRGLLQATRTRDVPLVTLIKGNTVYEDVPVLTGKCTHCSTTYHADHEHFKDQNGLWNKCYLNSARFLKVGQSMWVDRNFSHSVLSGMYNFHVSAAAYTQYWNDCNSITSSNIQITRRLTWQAFVQESIRTVASSKNINLELRENLNIKELVVEAFAVLGNTGVLEPAKEHSCSQCSQAYKATADFMANDDPAAVAGADENSNVPALAGEFADVSAPQIRANNLNMVANVDAMDVDYAPVKMVVLDGIVMGPTHCAYEQCTQDLKNARGGAFCTEHEILYGNRCPCHLHQQEWKKYKLDHSHSSLAGVKKMIQRPQESMPWQPGIRRTVQPHDQDEDIEIPQDHYFGPARFYCVETICAPCDYICIDKACKVLRTSIANGSWNMWQKTSRFIVDSYHYINHRTSDYLCRKWCNPAFNTQACEQLNSWLGGFESILKRMKTGNFDWFLHAMFFYHTQHVIQKQAQRETPHQIDDNEDEVFIVLH
ncbi:hypothetical protein BDZ97DRAFT_1908272 [Flammula alnicola]|nr:hypothetical protein BDZ97DRAFT_1908272 [Flammula alnicola]